MNLIELILKELTRTELIELARQFIQNEDAGHSISAPFLAETLQKKIKCEAYRLILFKGFHEQLTEEMKGGETNV